MRTIIALFPDKYKHPLSLALEKYAYSIEEIRIRINRPVELVLDGRYIINEKLVMDESAGQYILNQLSGFSRYKFEEELKRGYITISGGHRVGIVGRTVLENSSIKQIQSISSFNIRIARERIGIAKPIISSLIKNADYYNTLIIGPPQSGKTTLLRDLSRLIGTGWGHVQAKKVGIVDERSEIAGSKNGIPQYEVGVRTDVLDSCPKSEGMMLMIRSMSPDLLIVDEIGSADDILAIQEAIRSGVNLICSLHGDSYQMIKKRAQFAHLIEDKYFERYLVLDHHKKITVLNQEGQEIDRNRGIRHELDWSHTLNRSDHLNRV